MTAHSQPSAGSGDPQRKPPRWDRETLVLFGVVIACVVSLSGAVLIGQARSGSAVIQVAYHAPPPAAEPYGRAWGPANAPITVVAYTDYSCAPCRQFVANEEHDVITEYAGTGKVRFEIRYAPFNAEGAKNAAQAASCAAEQDRFWAMHMSLFLNQPQAGASESAGFSFTGLSAIAERLGLNVPAFQECLVSGTFRQEVDDAVAESERMKITMTPTYIVNGRTYPGPVSVDRFRQIFAEVAPNVTFE